MYQAPRARGVVPAPGEAFASSGRKRVILLGATGSIGRQTIDVIRRHPDELELVAIAANSSLDKLVEAAQTFPSIRHIALSNASLRDDPRLADLPEHVEVRFGKDAVDELPQALEADVVLNALSGFAGMRASMATLQSGKVLALANKESLVAAGDLVMPLAKPGTLLPVDSEHSAIFQCLLGEDPWRARLIWLTASGGPFFGKTRDALAAVTPQDALRHPNWNMGARITIDSATMMNKGLEIIEAYHLFQMPFEQIRVVVQRQSAVHSMVEFDDGTVKAHLGAADMRVPIQFALSFPDRWEAPCPPADWPAVGHVDFADPDPETFSCLQLAISAGTQGGILPCAMNAADETAVASFLAGEIGFLDIAAVMEETLGQFGAEAVESVEQLEDADARARDIARRLCAVKGGRR